MVAAVPGYKISTGYGVPGNWSGGRHGGVDYAAPLGKKVVAPWSGRVLGISWGNAYGIHVVIDFDRLPDGSPGLWGVSAHLSRKTVIAGQRVAAGQKIGEVGSTGFSTGPHNHFEVQPQANWVKGSHVDPMPWILAGDSTPPATKWLFPAGSKVHRSKVCFNGHETNDDRESDSIKKIQEMLNAHKMPGGANLPISGKYWVATDKEVRLCQQLHGYGNDPERGSYVGPKQFAHLKEVTGAPYVWYDDGPPVIGDGSIDKPEQKPQPETWFVPASLKALKIEVDYRWPERDRSLDGTIGDAAHQQSKSEHNPVGSPNGPVNGTPGAVHAMDLTVEGADAQAILDALIGDHRVWYVIHAGSIWSKNHGPWDKRPYEGDPHARHIHVSLAADDQVSAVRNELDASSWFETTAPPPDLVTRAELEELQQEFDAWRQAVADAING